MVFDDGVSGTVPMGGDQPRGAVDIRLATFLRMGSFGILHQRIVILTVEVERHFVFPMPSISGGFTCHPAKIIISYIDCKKMIMYTCKYKQSYLSIMRIKLNLVKKVESKLSNMVKFSIFNRCPVS